MSFDFSNKNAVVTGGANGIGLAAAQALAFGGARVWILDLEDSGTPDVAQFLPCDVTDPESISIAFAKIGAPDIVVANAGTGSEAELTGTARRDWDRIIALNLSGVFHTAQTAAALMKPRRS